MEDYREIETCSVEKTPIRTTVDVHHFGENTRELLGDPVPIDIICGSRFVNGSRINIVPRTSLQILQVVHSSAFNKLHHHRTFRGMKYFGNVERCVAMFGKICCCSSGILGFVPKVQLQWQILLHLFRQPIELKFWEDPLNPCETPCSRGHTTSRVRIKPGVGVDTSPYSMAANSSKCGC